jgi:hypothetical protein
LLWAAVSAASAATQHNPRLAPATHAAAARKLERVMR